MIRTRLVIVADKTAILIIFILVFPIVILIGAYNGATEVIKESYELFIKYLKK